jgi:hypothetical protein
MERWTIGAVEVAAGIGIIAWRGTAELIVLGAISA